MTDKLKIAEAIERAALVIRIPEWWTQGDYARFESGAPAYPWSEKAACFCGLGAIEAAGLEMGGSELAINAIRALNKETGMKWFPAFNDSPGRTSIEVSDAMLAAAQRIRESAC